MDTEYEYKRALLFMERKVMVHVSTNVFWCNGLLLEVAPTFFVVKDRKDGNEKFIYFSELKKSLEPYTKREEKNGNSS